MRPVLLTMEAFGSYADKTTIDFTKPQQNLFLITGETGSGKTTIFDAIVYALYGEGSSDSSHKDKGADSDLHSQLTDETRKIEVTLVFEEKGEKYTVTREGKHIEIDSKGNRKSKNSKVRLVLPDGRDYTDGSVDSKLKELIGVDKKQFMKVAMIAQGEFIDLLQNTFKTRKELFRKFFDTGIYDQIKKTLTNRKNAKEEQLHAFRSQYLAHAAAVRLPEDSEYGARLAELKAGFNSEKALSITAIESFSELLKSLCGELGEKLSAAQKDHAKAAAEYNEKRDACKSADELLKNYTTLENAKKQLAVCEAGKADIENAEKLAAEIASAYTVNAAYKLYEQAEKAAADTAAHLEVQKQMLPILEKDCAAAASEEKAAVEQAEKASAEAAAVSARTSAALEQFKKIEEAAKETAFRQGELKKAEAASEAAKKRAAAHEVRIGDLRKRLGELESTQDELLKLEKVNSVQTEIESCLSRTDAAEQKLAECEKTARSILAEYAGAQKRYDTARSRYESQNRIFLNNQAGYIAREMLKPGEKCPVCGSLTHPEPATVPDVYSGLTREMIDGLKAEADELGREYTACSERSKNAGENLNAAKEQFSVLMKTLNELIIKNYRSVESELALEDARIKVRTQHEAIDKWSEKLSRDKQELESIKKDLGSADEKSRTLAEELRLQEAKAAEARSALENIRGQRDALEQGLAFSSKEEALSVRDKAEAVHRAAAQRHIEALSKLTNAQSKRDNCKALITRDNEELPAKNSARDERLAEYREVMESSGLSEEKWKQTVSLHERSEADALAKKASAHHEAVSRAQTAAEIAEKNIAGRPKPDIEKLTAEYDEAEAVMKRLDSLCGDLKSMYDADEHLLGLVLPGLEERRKVCAEYDVIKRLHSKLFGSKMDIESYVLRWHLMQVLEAANVRFLEMTAGQLELVFTEDQDEDDAEEKTRSKIAVKPEHGLSLMVRSVATGKLRRIRRISGGEKFMAALSLALGMADRICEHSTSVDLGILFIDEGFGSLSENKLRSSVRILKQLAGSSKLVGIISHVSALTQEIDDQLLVTRTERGSSAKWIQE